MIKHIKKAIDPHLCEYILKDCMSTPSWVHARHDGRYFNHDGSNNGMQILINFAESKDPISRGDVIATYANILYALILMKSGLMINNPHLHRIIINSYSRASSCIEHTDDFNPNTLSCIVYLTENAGDYTEIEGEKVYGDIGDIVIFESNKLHHSTGAVGNNFRANVNIMIDTDGWQNGEA